MVRDVLIPTESQSQNVNKIIKSSSCNARLNQESDLPVELENLYFTILKNLQKKLYLFSIF